MKEFPILEINDLVLRELQLTDFDSYYDYVTDEMIGIISLDNVSFFNKNFSIAYVIRKKYCGYHYAYQFSYALIEYIFKNTDIHRLKIAYNVDNIVSKKTILKLGAKLEEFARESKFYDNAFKDRKIYSI